MAGEPVAKRRRIAVNSVFSVFAWLFPILVGFISTPILVRRLGSEQYGLFAVVLGFISYSFAFGVGKVVGKYVPEFQASGDEDKVAQVISATFWVSVLIGVTGGLALALSSGFIVRDVLLISPEVQAVAIYALCLAAAVGVATMLSQVFQFVLQGLHRFDNYAALTNLNGILLGVGNIVLVVSGFGVVALLVWNLAVVTAVGLLFYLRARHLLPNVTLLTKLPRPVIDMVARYAGSIILYQIFANVLFIFERSWVTRKFGAEGLTHYFVPMLIALYMHGFVASIVQSIFPAVNELLGSRDRVAELYRRANKILLVVVVFSVTSFIAAGLPFLTTWINAEIGAISYPLLVAHGLTFGVIAIGVMAFQLADAFKFPALNVIMTGSWMVLAIPLMIVAAERWGMEGVAWARFAAALVTFPIVAYTEHRFLGKLQWRFWLAVGSRLAVAAVVAGLVEWGILGLIENAYVSLLIAGLAGAASFVGVLALTGFLTPEERAFLRNSFSRGVAKVESPVV